jgi:hypothetical protein
MTTHDILGRDTDEAFAMPELSDACIDAANRTAKLFDAHYPGWFLYSRIERDDQMYDRQIASWAIGMARQYSRSRKGNGRTVVAPRARGNDWISQAGVDAVECLIKYGDPAVFDNPDAVFEEPAYSVSSRLGVDRETYQKFRLDLAQSMFWGYVRYCGALRWQYIEVLFAENLAA